jgi:hypothetical protein
MKRPKTLKELANYIGDVIDIIVSGGEPPHYGTASVAAMAVDIHTTPSNEVLVYSYHMPIMALRRNDNAPHGYEININSVARGYSATTNKHLGVAYSALGRLNKSLNEYTYPNIRLPRWSGTTIKTLLEDFEYKCRVDRDYFIKCKRQDHKNSRLDQTIGVLKKHMHTLLDCVPDVHADFVANAAVPLCHKWGELGKARGYTPKEYAAILTAEQALDYEPNPMGIA